MDIAHCHAAIVHGLLGAGPTQSWILGGAQERGASGGLPAPGHPCLSPQEALFVLLQYLPPGVISLVNFLGPLLFTFLVQLENYPPNTEVNLTLMW